MYQAWHEENAGIFTAAGHKAGSEAAILAIFWPFGHLLDLFSPYVEDGVLAKHQLTPSGHMKGVWIYVGQQIASKLSKIPVKLGKTLVLHSKSPPKMQKMMLIAQTEVLRTFFLSTFCDMLYSYKTSL